MHYSHLVYYNAAAICHFNARILHPIRVVSASYSYYGYVSWQNLTIRQLNFVQDGLVIFFRDELLDNGLEDELYTWRNRLLSSGGLTYMTHVTIFT
jgi:hypothetical protein